MTIPERRGGRDRRQQDIPVAVERRRGERRLESAAAQIQAALDLLLRVADAGTLGDEDRRLLEAAMLRLRFAAERMEKE